MDFPIDHDLHCHSRLSLCSNDPAQTPEAILAHAKAHGYTCVCLTDHFWDSPVVPGASGFYGPQDLAHVQENLPLPDGGAVRFAFGCETEWCGGAALGIAPEHHGAFDFIVVPPNHFHMKGFYLASDAHHPGRLSSVPDVGPSVVSALGLSARHLYRLP